VRARGAGGDGLTDCAVGASHREADGPRRGDGGARAVQPRCGRAWLGQEPLDELEPDVGAPGAPAPEWDPLPMLGQFWLDPEPELPEPEPVLALPELPVLPELELESVLVPDEPEVVLVVLDPEFPVDELVPPVELVELVPEPDVEPEVVAAPATNAPPATRPEASAPAASTFRNRMCIGVAFLCRCCARSLERTATACAPDLWATAHSHRCARRVR